MAKGLSEAMLEAGVPFPSVQSSDELYSPEGFAVFRTRLKDNETGGRDYWVTIREFGESISKGSELIGIVEGKQVRVGDYIPLAAAEHLQEYFVDACREYNQAKYDEELLESGRHDDDGHYEGNFFVSRFTHTRAYYLDPLAGKLQFIASGFDKKFEKPTRYFDGVKYTDEHGTRRKSRHVTERYYVAYKREEVSKLKGLD